MADATFSVGGLASGLDTNAIIDKLVQAESRQLALLRKRQTGYQAQVSALGAIATQLSALEAAARSLGDGGALGLTVAGSPAAFQASPGARAAAGSWSVQVTELASAAKWRSTGFAAGATFAAGTLALTVQGQPYGVALAAGSTLADVAGAIQRSGAPVSVSVLSSGGLSYLALTARDTGYPAGGPASAALSVDTGVGTAGAALGLASLQVAANAAFTADGLAFSSASNLISDAIPGVTLTLRAKGGAAEPLTLQADAPATQAKLQAFAAAYNGVLSLVQKSLAVTAQTDRAATLAGDSTLRYLQSRLQGLISTQVPGSSQVTSLADLGFKTARDGSLSIDSDVLSSALARDPAAVGAIFSTSTSGMGDVVSAVVHSYVNPADGLLAVRQSGVNQTLRALRDDQARWETRIAAYREGLVQRFTAMETAVSQLKNLGSYLNTQSIQTTK